MPDTMVLRFRDLAGDTIPEHQSIIAAHGYCWWGWWNKPDEKIPRDVMAAFQERIQSDGHLDAFLIDSGEVRLYRARVIDISISSTNQLRPCPEPTKTPEYYRDRKWKMWFKMDHIEEVENGESEIREWSYDEVPELIDDPLGQAYQDKRVHGLREMLDRKHRTIYFVRRFRQGHRDELLTPALPALPNTPFIARPMLARSSYMLHLSDLHFGRSPDGKPMHEFGTGADVHEPSLANLLSTDLEHLFGETPPAAVIVSGDLTWRAAPEEFDQAAEFLRDLRSIYDLNPQQILIVPGNHDIAWAEAAGDYDPNARVARARKEAEEPYRRFFSRAFGFELGEHLSGGRRFVLDNYVPVDLLGLNSCILEQQHFSGYGFVSIEQLIHAAREMEWGEPRGDKYRVVVMHHHLMSVAPQEEVDRVGRMYSVTLDAGDIVYRLLTLEADLVLHGHQHQPFASSISRRPNASDFPPGRSLALHATGSAGVARSHVGAIGKNAYTILEFARDHIRVQVRAKSEQAVGFQQHWATTFTSVPGFGMRLGDP